jgi:hypothetical protein
VIFQTQIFGTLFQWFSAVAHTGFAAIGTPPPVTDCTLSLVGNCGSLPLHYDPNHLPTITFFDLEFALYMAAIALFFFALYVLALVVVLQIDNPPGAAILTAIQKLQIRKAIVLAFEAIITPLQRALWPAFIFAGVLSIAIAAKETQHYIQLLSCQHQAQFGTLPASLKGASGCTPAWVDVTAKGYAYLGVSLALAAAAAVAVVLAAVVQLYVRGKPAASGRQVAGYWIPAFGLLAWTVLIPFGIFTLPLLLINVVLYFAVSFTIPLAFFPPGIVSYVAFVALVIVVGVRWLHARSRGGAPS